MNEHTHDPESPPAPSTRSDTLSLLALLIGAAAFALVVIPPYVLSVPAYALADDDDGASKRSVAFKIKDFEVKLGKPQTTEEETSRARARRGWVRNFHVAGFALAICGLIVAPFAWVRERRRPLVATGVALGCMALLWQWIVIGVIVAVVVFFLGLAGGGLG